MAVGIEIGMNQDDKSNQGNKKRRGVPLNTNRIITPEMLETNRDLALEIVSSRVAEAFKDFESFIEFCKEAWEAKKLKRVNHLDRQIEQLSADEKAALLARLQPAKGTTAKIKADE
jgi:hypothetical protein